MKPFICLTLAGVLFAAMTHRALTADGTARTASQAVYASLETQSRSTTASSRKPAVPPALSPTQLCHQLQTNAVGWNLPASFFVRLIWQESRFDHTAVSRRGARGLAQFMPPTARQWGLHNPFDPAMSLKKSAELLAYLVDKFGNVGLAAAAYNAGPVRVRNWLKGRTGLPLETRNYVEITTGRTARDWRDDISDVTEMDHDAGPPSDIYSYTLEDWCLGLAAKVGKYPWPRSPWNVRVAEDVSRKEAMREVEQLNKRLDTPAKDTRPLLDPLDKVEADGSPRFAVDIAANTRREAWELCSRMRKRGESCRIRRG